MSDSAFTLFRRENKTPDKYYSTLSDGCQLITLRQRQTARLTHTQTRPLPHCRTHLSFLSQQHGTESQHRTHIAAKHRRSQKPHKEAHQQPHRTRRNQKNEPQEHIRHSPIAIRPADSNPSRAYRIAQHNTRSAPFLCSAPPHNLKEGACKDRAGHTRLGRWKDPTSPPTERGPRAAHPHSLTREPRSHRTRSTSHTHLKPDLTDTHTNSTHTHNCRSSTAHNHTTPKEANEKTKGVQRSGNHTTGKGSPHAVLEAYTHSHHASRRKETCVVTPLRCLRKALDTRPSVPHRAVAAAPPSQRV